MTKLQDIKAEKRITVGTGATRAVRRAGFLPGIVYGDKKEPVAISINAHSIKKDINHPSFFTKVFNLDLEGNKENVIAKDVQRHPVTDLPLHIDFQRVSKDSQIHIAIPIFFVHQDKCPGIKRGGVLNIVTHDLPIVCSPDLIPESIIVDLEGLNINDSIHVKNIKLPQGVRPDTHDLDATIAVIVPPTVDTAKAETDTAAAAPTTGTTTS